MMISNQSKYSGDVTKDIMLKVDSYAKLRNSFWIPYICFDPSIDDFYEKEHVKLYKNNPSD
jgi:hypothetical protein